MNKVLASIAAVALSATITGCAPTTDGSIPGFSATCQSAPEGTALGKLEVLGGYGTLPTFNFEAPLTSTQIETKILSSGDGIKFTGDQFVELDFMAINGGTGETLQATKFDGTDSAQQFVASGRYPDFCSALAGVRAGSRISVLLPAEFAHKSEGAPESGIGKDDSIIYVIDVRSVYLPYAVGAKQPAVPGFPSVVLAPNGTPGITQLKEDAPKDFKLATLIKGDGEVLSIGDSIVVHYSGFVWGGESFDSSWESNQPDKKIEPAKFQLAESNLIKGFVKALEGQTVGSQVIAIIPPSEGYGEQGQGSIPPNATLIFVIDILGTKKPAL
jgi:peptidylprolyl isomerase